MERGRSLDPHRVSPCGRTASYLMSLLRLVTLEPVIFGYLFSFGIQSIIVQVFRSTNGE